MKAFHHGGILRLRSVQAPTRRPPFFFLWSSRCVGVSVVEFLYLGANC